MDEATVSCFVKTTTALSAGNTGLLCNYDDNLAANTTLTPSQGFVYGPGFGVQLAVDTTGASASRAHLRGKVQGPPIAESTVGAVQGAPIKTPVFTIADGKWHQVAVSWKQGGSMIAYTDGVQVATSAANPGTRDIFYAPQRGPVIGGIRNEANRSRVDQLFHGSMDELKVYNYAMTADEIAMDYYNGSGQGACNRTYQNQYDYNGNCVVDLGDFSVLAANWLNCGRTPLSTCP
jgi:hypothetical protein